MNAPVAWFYEVDVGHGWSRQISLTKPIGNDLQRNITPLYAAAASQVEVLTAPVIKSFVGSTRDDRCLEVWFADKVTEETRAWLLAAINEKALAGAEKPGAPHDLPFHKETMNGLNSLTIRQESAPVAQAAPDLHAWRFIKGDGQWSPWIVLPDAEAVAAFKDLMGHNLERGTHQLQSFAATSPVPSAQLGCGDPNCKDPNCEYGK